MNHKTTEFPLIYEIVEEYRALRRSGVSREEAIGRIELDYVSELADENDGPLVKAGLAVALCQKTELTKDVQTAALDALCQLPEAEESEPVRRELLWLKTYVSDTEHLGEEAVYRVVKPYIPNWEIDDTFAHQLTTDLAEKYGIPGWYVIFRKTGEYVDHHNHYQQYGYVSLCPPDRLPQTSKELEGLGYLRTTPWSRQKWNYLVQITLSSKRTENAYGFTKIGHFTDVHPPEDRTEENPVVAMPLSEQRRKYGSPCPWPIFEDAVCEIYNRNLHPRPWQRL